MMHSTRLTLVLFLITLPFHAARSQDELPAEATEPRRFAVEMIIFRYTQDVSTGSEVFPGDRRAVEQAYDDSEPAYPDDDPIEEVPRFYRSVELEKLPRDQYALEDILARLRRLDVYDPLMHFGWTQLTWPDEETLPVELSTFGRPPAGLSGSLRLYLGRFLHLVVDLELDAPQAADSRSDVPSYGDAQPLDAYADRARPAPVRYRIFEDRIFRSGELRYFDHPKFGVLAKITRVEQPSEPAPGTLPASGETELLGYPPE